MLIQRLSGILKNNLAFFVSAVFSVIGSLMLLIGAVIWTVIIHKIDGINKLIIAAPSNPPLGIVVTTGEGLYLCWAAFVLLAVSTVPYMIRFGHRFFVTYRITDGYGRSQLLHLQRITH